MSIVDRYMVDSGGITFVKSVAYFATSAFSKLPLIYMLMLLWGGVIVGLQGQAVMFLIYTAMSLVAYGIVRPVLASTSSPSDSTFLYSLIPGIQSSETLLREYLSVFMGIPSSLIPESSNQAVSWIQKYILLSVPDAMIFPSSFMYGYGITTAENGVSDSRNMPMLFMTILSILLQLNITQMGGIAAFLNVVTGMFVGVLGGSFVSENPDLGPFNTSNQSFNMVVTNVA